MNINKILLSIILITLGAFFNKMNAQYVGVELKLKQERLMETLLPFGFQSPQKPRNATTEAEKESFLGKGVYAIGANENVRVLVNVTYSDNLVDKQKNKIPFELTMKYQNDGTKDEKSSLLVDGSTVDFMLNNSGRLIKDIKTKDYVLRAYVFLNGRINTNLNYKFPLKGEILLNVEYE